MPAGAAALAGENVAHTSLRIVHLTTLNGTGYRPTRSGWRYLQARLKGSDLSPPQIPMDEVSRAMLGVGQCAIEQEAKNLASQMFRDNRDFDEDGSGAVG